MSPLARSTYTLSSQAADETMLCGKPGSITSVAGDSDGLNLAIPLPIVMKIFPEAVFTKREFAVIVAEVGTCTIVPFSIL